AREPARRPTPLPAPLAMARPLSGAAPRLPTAPDQTVERLPWILVGVLGMICLALVVYLFMQ
nr:hypothetical protein [Myxococcota bacterium]